MLAMASPERVVAIDIGKRRQLSRERIVTRFFASVKSQVFKKYDSAVFKSINFFSCVRTHGVFRESDWFPKDFSQPFGSWFKTVL